MRIELKKGDITHQETDAIVNAANNELKGGGGVDGAIHRAGGPAIMKECQEIGYCETGQAVITTAGKLPAKKVIHTVGPVWKGGDQNEEALLSSCYKTSLELAAKNDLKTIAFPNISTGVYGYPKQKAAKIAVNTVKDTAPPKIERVIFVCFDDENHEIYENLLNN
ncbi:O-acetyl-ADP-ribose deacetylase [Robertkochia aurantiaca]|uniref:O-acetyl-ADP-ribose deacetylase n=1 Tax=Robertkochia aurantiaca TaxID=2873700 RepID=UPI001CC9AF21|nr:O-acetyl-ADP-ribose deacetylase [Robertkochia sp. 3YJGBD-33]